MVDLCHSSPGIWGILKINFNEFFTIIKCYIFITREFLTLLPAHKTLKVGLFMLVLTKDMSYPELIHRGVQTEKLRPPDSGLRLECDDLKPYKCLFSTYL